MTKLISYSLIAFTYATLLSSCGGGASSDPQGQLVGNPNKMSYSEPIPKGMVWVPSGVLHMGASDQDTKGGYDTKLRTVQMEGFYMDATEVTNMEYRQYTDWVRDSITHTILGDFKDNPDGTQSVDWKKKIKWGTDDVSDAMAAYYIPANESIWGKKEFDNTKLKYHYESFDYDEMARSNGKKPRLDYLRKYDISCYPDTTCWIKMFTYSYNEPIAQQYNWFKAFDQYPVVGVNWNQANAFNHWRTKIWREAKDKKKQYLEGDFRLPSEEQWEWAARGGLQQSPYPWGGPYIINKKGCYLANFKPNRGNYSADGGLYTVKVGSYHENQYGLYDMSGNVSEWTSSPYLSNAYGLDADISPEIRFKATDNDPLWWKRKVIRGGSWKDVAYYLQVSTRDYEFEDTSKAFIGFRSIIPQISTALTNKPKKK